MLANTLRGNVFIKRIAIILDPSLGGNPGQTVRRGNQSNHNVKYTFSAPLFRISTRGTRDLHTELEKGAGYPFSLSSAGTFPNGEMRCPGSCHRRLPRIRRLRSGECLTANLQRELFDRNFVPDFVSDIVRLFVAVSRDLWIRRYVLSLAWLDWISLMLQKAEPGAGASASVLD
jgi:hypothetical protein